MTRRTISNVQAKQLVKTPILDKLIKDGQSVSAGEGLELVAVMQGGKLAYCLQGARARIDAVLAQTHPRPTVTRVEVRRYHKRGDAARLAQL